MPARDTHLSATPSPPSTLPLLRTPRLLLALAILITGLLGSLLAAWTVQRSIDREAIAAFAKVCDEVTLKVKERLTTYRVLLRGARGLFAASEIVDRDERHAYCTAMEARRIMPGFEGIGLRPADPAH